jgi:hypothetical protein
MFTSKPISLQCRWSHSGPSRHCAAGRQYGRFRTEADDGPDFMTTRPNSADGRAEPPKKTLSAIYYRRRAEVLRLALITTRRPEAAVRLRALTENYRALADRAAREARRRSSAAQSPSGDWQPEKELHP